MKISIITLFPQMFEGPFDYSIVKRTKEKNLLAIEFINLRDFGIGRHKIVDDTPYGGGVGMVLRVDVIEKTINKAKCEHECNERIILTDARGKTYSQQKVKELSGYDHLILIAGHYEGVDERILDLVDETISIGDYVLTGGEIPIMVLVDSIVRLIPGALKQEAVANESFSQERILEHPQYTKPQVFKNKKVPQVLLSGDHKKIEQWRKKHSKKQN